MKKFLIAIPAFFLIVTPVLAQSVTPPVTQNANQANRIANAKAKADAEIDRRVTSINNLITHIQGLKRLSDADKTNFLTKAQTEINALTTLRAKIDADTDVPTLRNDIKSIFNEYRVYALFLPQVRILSSVDVMGDIADAMGQLASKLQTRINTAKSNGHDVTALQASLDDLQAKLTDAKTQYTNAENTVTGLVPDLGDKTKLASNTAALQSARADIKAGAADLKAGRQDIQSIITGLKSFASSAPTPTP